ncbi:MAG TPA: basic secretory protein-like protein [Gemmatimonadaceae bacterium]|nr:basic secretory protein-like protein [Gemmatimonadaceae bacterium]
MRRCSSGRLVIGLAGSPVARAARRSSLVAGLLVGVLAALVAFPATTDAQYFGRNKVQYDQFDFKVLSTPHFNVLFYPAESLATADAGRMAERWFARLSPTMHHKFDRRSIVLYADSPDFQQTNVVSGEISQGTGGVTEGLRERVTMPFTTTLGETDHVLGHELVHVFQYDIASTTQQNGLQSLGNVPLWMIEGMAEYLSVGRVDAHTAMWLRDAMRRDDLPTVRQLTTDPRYFPYRFGQALWAYVGGRWSDDAVEQVFRASLRLGYEDAILRVLGVSHDTLSARWHADIRRQYEPLLVGRSAPDSIGRSIVGQGRGEGDQNISPSVSPDGRYVAFYSSRGLFGFDLLLADARTGRVVRELATATSSSPDFDQIAFIASAGAWSPDGRLLAFPVYEDGDNTIAVLDVNRRRVVRRVKPQGVGAVNDPTFSPDGRQLAFSGQSGGITDLYVMEMASGEVRQLTRGLNAEVQPQWSPDGRQLVFATDRDPGTDFERLTYAPLRLALFDMTSGEVRLLPRLGRGKHINPHWSPDGGSIYFVSDADGFSDIYRMALGDSALFRVTRTATGVSGITAQSPAISVARSDGNVYFSTFNDAGYTIRALSAAEAQGTPVSAASIVASAVMPAGAPTADTVVVMPPSPLPPAPADSITPPADSVSVPADTLRARVPVDTLRAPTDTLRARADTAAAQPTQQQPDAARIGALLPPPGAITTSAVGQYLRNADEGLPRDTTFAVADYKPKLSIDYIGVPSAGVAYNTAFGAGFQGAVAALFNDELNNRTVEAIVQANGQVEDIGGQLAYYNREHRWNWGGGVSHIPYLSYLTFLSNATNVSFDANLLLQRIYSTEAFGFVQYPLSSTKRWEFGLSAQRIGYGLELITETIVGNQVVDRQTSEPDAPDPLYLGRASAAFVGDNSFFGFVSPVAGSRYRFEFSPALGSLNYQTGLADYRRYFFKRPITFAVRGLFYGRFGADAEAQELTDLYLGYPTLVRGYDVNTFEGNECSVTAAGDCPEYTRLLGSRIGVASAELRIPLIGTRDFGLIDLPFLPTELSLFTDVGVAWTKDESPDFSWERRTTARVPVVGSGATARFNLLGFAVVEVFYVYPWQRPDKGAYWGWQLSPGW